MGQVYYLPKHSLQRSYDYDIRTSNFNKYQYHLAISFYFI